MYILRTAFVDMTSTLWCWDLYVGAKPSGFALSLENIFRMSNYLLRRLTFSLQRTHWLKWPQQVGSKLGLNLKMKISFIYLNEMENKLYFFYTAGILVHQTFLCLRIGTRSVVSSTLWPHGLLPVRLLRPWNSPGKNTGVGCHAHLQRIFPTQGSNPGLPYCRRILYHLSHQGSPVLGYWCRTPGEGLTAQTHSKFSVLDGVVKPLSLTLCGGGMRAARTCFAHPPQHGSYWESGCLRQAFPEEGEGLRGAEQGASIRWNTSLGEASAVSSSSFHTYKWKEREGRFHLPTLWATVGLKCLSLTCRPSPPFLSSLPWDDDYESHPSVTWKKRHVQWLIYSSVVV